MAPSCMPCTPTFFSCLHCSCSSAISPKVGVGVSAIFTCARKRWITKLPLRCRRGREPPRVLVILPVGAEAAAYESLEFFPIANSLTRDLSDTGCFAVLSVFPKCGKISASCPPLHSQAMERAALLAWLAEVHEIREERDLNYPMTPALAALLHLSYDFEWDDRCYQEVQMLGEASGLHFKEYVRVQPTHLNRPGDCAMNPIVFDDEVSERPLHEDTPLERVPKLQRRPGSCESVGSASAAGFPSASAWKSFRPTLSQLQPEKASSSSEANGISSPKFESTTQSYNPDEAELTTESEEYRECWRSMPYLGPDFIVPSRKELYPGGSE